MIIFFSGKFLNLNFEKKQQTFYWFVIDSFQNIYIESIYIALWVIDNTVNTSIHPSIHHHFDDNNDVCLYVCVRCVWCLYILFENAYFCQHDWLNWPIFFFWLGLHDVNRDSLYSQFSPFLSLLYPQMHYVCSIWLFVSFRFDFLSPFFFPVVLLQLLLLFIGLCGWNVNAKKTQKKIFNWFGYL